MPMASISPDLHALSCENCSQMVNWILHTGNFNKYHDDRAGNFCYKMVKFFDLNSLIW
jgi:hypothetical protein